MDIECLPPLKERDSSRVRIAPQTPQNNYACLDPALKMGRDCGKCPVQRPPAVFMPEREAFVLLPPCLIGSEEVGGRGPYVLPPAAAATSVIVAQVARSVIVEVSETLGQSVANGNAARVKEIFKHRNITGRRRDELVILAARNGHPAVIVELLLSGYVSDAATLTVFLDILSTWRDEPEVYDKIVIAFLTYARLCTRFE